ncbi:uncharacterized protein F4807DRAFT_468569 [Annulohypoxylon truncatum]|uniref:uncharacterized protein n=1 Tax=Annulohypoxylon truncatum TaxID=327061 RepID=UPI00200755D1|nr:uncharacterized protein F4807DRAFT_468569 [Annulohypoxylon truncatum]KAI1208636.1 hypothetical protein F4807DRAFT_468569 [Annulohypoxylon truncatum]
MFEPQWQELSRKRQREEEEGEGQVNIGDAMNGTLGFTEHRNKRLQSLPLRTSPTQKQWAGAPDFPVATSATTPPASISPTDSDSEDAQYRQQANLSMDVDRDMDMMVDSSERYQTGPSHTDFVDPSIAGRMPTPIHCTFAAQVRGNNWGPMNQTMHTANGSIDAAATEAQPFPTCHDESSVPRSLGGSAEWSMVQNRRLPSPISESGGEETPTSPGMVLDSRQPQRPYLPHMPHSTNPHAMPMHPNIQTVPPTTDNDSGMTDADPGSSPSSAPATPSPRGKYGHSRSKHTLNNWTLQPGMKKSFSIGYRADCEKCRMKIPGHFNHIIIS